MVFDKGSGFPGIQLKGKKGETVLKYNYQYQYHYQLLLKQFRTKQPVRN